MLSIRKCPAFETVAAGKKAVLTTDPGIRIHRLTLIVGNAAIAQNDLSNGETTVEEAGGQRAERQGRHSNAERGVRS